MASMLDGPVVTAVVWPYEDCTLFTKGDIVLYRSSVGYDFKKHTTVKFLRFWHPKKRSWEISRRPDIMEDTCSTLMISQKMIQSEPPGVDISTVEWFGSKKSETGVGGQDITSGG